ncbi:MAG: C-GCAxxG-C-C family (seleno)protein [Geobacteraceae bacterium]
MPVKKAVHSYTNERLNCAQSIFNAFYERKGLPRDAVTEARKFGGGRAENGTCGALYAALSLLDDPAKKESLRQSFLEVAGSEQCREIRAKSLISCLQCVEIAARFLERADS